MKFIDSIQELVVKGNYAEFFELKDSLFVVDKAVAVSVMEKDSMFVHGDTILVTGKTNERVVRTFNNVKIFKSNIQGKCDSIHTSQLTGLTKMFRNPVLWSENGQITGDTIHFSTNKKTNQLDSLKILNNSFMIQKDTIDTSNFNQIKGRNIYGKFKNNDLNFMLVKGNAESLYYNRNEESLKLETITKEIASDIEFTFENSEIIETKYYKQTEGQTFPPSDFPEKEKKFNGFIWREEEQPKTKEDIFIKDDESVISKDKETNSEVEKAKKTLSKENKKREKKPKRTAK